MNYMKTKYLYLSVLSLLAMASCDEGIDETYLKETPSKVYLATSGYISQSIYDFGEETQTFDLYVNKSGYVDIPANVSFSYDSEVLTEYQETNFDEDMVALPVAVGSFTESSVSMSGDQTLAKTSLVLSMPEIRALKETSPEAKLVFPIRISVPEGDAVEINTDKEYLLMQVDLITPVANLKGKGSTIEVQADVFRNPDLTSVTLPLEIDLPFENDDYSFSFAYEAAPDLVADYNDRNASNYELLPESYTMPELKIEQGDSKGVANIRIDLSSIPKSIGGKTYLLPVRVTDSGNDMIPVEEDAVCYFKVKLVAKWTGAWSNTIHAAESGLSTTAGTTYQTFMYSRADALELLTDATIQGALAVITDEEAIVCPGWAGTMFEQCSPIIKITNEDAGGGKKKVEILAGWAREGAGWEAVTTANNKSTYDPEKNEIYLDYTGAFGWGAYHIQRTYSNQVIQESYQ